MEAVALAPAVLFTIGSLKITTTFILQIFISLFLMTIFLWVAKNWQKRPKKLQLIVESIIEFMFLQVDKVTTNRQKTLKVFPLVFTLFIFILTSNLFTNIPGMGAWTILTSEGIKTPLFRSVLADYSAILVLTLITVTVAQFVFILTQGFGKYLKQFLDFSGPINFFLGLMNLIGEIAKILSLSFRLFGNVFAGEVLMSIITALVPFILPLPFFVLTLFSAVIQAYVFAILSTVFVSANIVIKE